MGEVVEAQYLRAYRTTTSMQALRPFLQALREEFGVPCPLAHFRPYLDRNRDLIVDLQERSDLPDPSLLAGLVDAKRAQSLEQHHHKAAIRG